MGKISFDDKLPGKLTDLVNGATIFHFVRQQFIQNDKLSGNVSPTLAKNFAMGIQKGRPGRSPTGWHGVRKNILF